MTERVGYWVDMSNPYWTMSPEYVDSVWWALQQINDQGLLVQDHRIAPYCPRCGTELSDHEVAQGYETIKHGRFGDWLANNVDWALSRNRYWGTPVAFSCPTCGKQATRASEVIDAWFDSGSMPFAGIGYPYAEGSVEQFEKSYPLSSSAKRSTKPGAGSTPSWRSERWCSTAHRMRT